jgi:hypothetical protein
LQQHLRRGALARLVGRSAREFPSAWTVS